MAFKKKVYVHGRPVRHLLTRLPQVLRAMSFAKQAPRESMSRLLVQPFQHPENIETRSNAYGWFSRIRGTIWKVHTIRTIAVDTLP